MNVFFKIILIQLVIQSTSLSAFAQQINLFRTVYYPAEPNGGKAELDHFVKQEIVYPEQLLAQKVNGEAYITFIIDSLGGILYKEVIDEGPIEFQKEAERIFDKILWVKDKDRSTSKLGYEKIKFIFNATKYKKLVKKRGYDNLPYKSKEYSTEPIFFDINHLDEAPKILNANSINSFVQNNIKYPPIAYQRGLSGRVTVEFIVEPYGKISNARIIESLSGGCDEETLRLMRSIEWSPGTKDGKAVRCLYKYQLNFIHPGGTVR